MARSLAHSLARSFGVLLQSRLRARKAALRREQIRLQPLVASMGAASQEMALEMCTVVRKKLADMREQYRMLRAEHEAVRKKRIDYTIMSR